jgi:hypothetical protein
LHPKQVASLAQGLDDAGIGIPNRQSAEQRERIHIAPVAEHGGEDFSIGEPAGFARHKVIDTVRG